MNFRRRALVASALFVAAAVLVVFARRSGDASHASPATANEVPATATASDEPLTVTTSEHAPPTLAPSSTQPAAPPAPMDEPALMTLLRSANGNDPALAVELAREGNRRFPESPDAPERSSILIHALADLGRSSEARGEAERMVNHYPDSHWVREVELFTGAHRHRNAVLDAQGHLEFVDPPPS